MYDINDHNNKGVHYFNIDINSDACVCFVYRSIVRAWLDFWPLLMELWRVDPTMIVSRHTHRPDLSGFSCA